MDIMGMILSIITGICLGGLIIFGPSACVDLVAEWCARPFDEKVINIVGGALFLLLCSLPFFIRDRDEKDKNEQDKNKK